MATPSEKLADALEALHELQTNGSVAIRSADLSRTHRERLVKNGFLEEVIKGGTCQHAPMKRAGKARFGLRPFGNLVQPTLICMSSDEVRLLGAKTKGDIASLTPC